MIYSIVIAFFLFLTCLIGSLGFVSKKYVENLDVAAAIWKFVMAMLALSVAIILIVKVATQ